MQSLDVAPVEKRVRRERDELLLRGRRIAIFEPYPDFATNPTLVCLSEALTEHGAQVDVLMPQLARFPSVDCLVGQHPYPYTLRLWNGSMRETLREWIRGVPRLTSRSMVDRLFADNHYDLIIGVDPHGIVEAHRYAQKSGVPLVYLSFEIFFQDELTSSRDRREKTKECAASRSADLVIIQDEQRAQLLATENGLDLERFVHLPVSPKGTASTAPSDYLRKRFAISDGLTIVLHSGTFWDWTYAEELIENLSDWADDFVLVIHTKSRPGRRDKYVEMIRQADLPNVVLSTEPLLAQEYESLVASADIGLVLYKPVQNSIYAQKNIQSVGLSSGKFSYYMKFGLPVISIEQNTYSDLLRKYDFGENLSSVDELPSALDRVRRRQAWHSTEARRLFTEKLDFEGRWPVIASRLSRLQDGRRAAELLSRT